RWHASGWVSRRWGWPRKGPQPAADASSPVVERIPPAPTPEPIAPAPRLVPPPAPLVDTPLIEPEHPAQVSERRAGLEPPAPVPLPPPLPATPTPPADWHDTFPPGHVSEPRWTPLPAWPKESVDEGAAEPPALPSGHER